MARAHDQAVGRVAGLEQRIDEYEVMMSVLQPGLDYLYGLASTASLPAIPSVLPDFFRMAFEQAIHPNRGPIQQPDCQPNQMTNPNLRVALVQLTDEQANAPADQLAGVTVLDIYALNAHAFAARYQRGRRAAWTVEVLCAHLFAILSDNSLITEQGWQFD